MKTRHRIMSLCFLLVVFTLPIGKAHAQWSVDGLDPTEELTNYVVFVPDLDGGVWMVYEGDGLTYGEIHLQHFDSDGYKLLGPEGISVVPESLDTHGALYGAELTSDGGLIVAYDRRWYDIYTGIYVQRFSPEGERLFAPTGNLIAGKNFFLDPSHAARAPLQTCSDGNDGIWIFSGKGFSESIYITGANSDGTAKRSLYYLGEIDAYYQYAFLSDGSGGAFVFWANDYYHRDLLVQHFLSDGEPAYDEPKVALGENVSVVGSLFAAPDGRGGFYVQSNAVDGVFQMQRISPEGDPLWGRDGVIWAGYQVVPSEMPAVRSDGSVAVAMVSGSPYDSAFRYALLDTSGQFLADPETNVIDVLDDGGSDPCHVHTTADGMEVFVFRIRFNDAKEDRHFVSLHRMSSDGKVDLWADPPRILAEARTDERFARCYAYNLSDGSVFVALNTYHNYRLFVISQDGTVRDALDVPETGRPRTSPTRFEILSTWPNPFNNSVMVRFSSPGHTPASLDIYSIGGKLVNTLRIGARVSSGEVVWSPDPSLPSGIYFVRGRSGSNVRKIVYLR